MPMEKQTSTANVFDESSIWKILLKIAPPVMLAQLIQAMYNIVDSFFVGQYSGDGLTALSVIYPIQLIIVAIAVGTGVGVNTQMSQDYARGRTKKALRVAGAGTLLAVASWIIFTILSLFLLKPYVMTSAKSPTAVDYAMIYGNIVCIGSLGIFCESIWSKVHQAAGNMKLPMVAQIMGALTNIVLDPVLIFGIGPVPAMGIAGAAYATVAGQVVAALITCTALHKPPKLNMMKVYARRIYHLGFPNIFMQLLFTVYIVALNVILAGFFDEAVTVLGLYYKVQSFFFIPLYGLQTCIVPLLSYNHAKGDYDRCITILKNTVVISMAFMLVGFLCFEFVPGSLLAIFSKDAIVMEIGIPAFRTVGLSFFPAVISLTMPVFFQALGKGKPSIALSVTRQLVCLIPLFWLLSRIDLKFSWLAFPLSELITGTLGLLLLRHQLRQWRLYKPKSTLTKKETISMKLITAVISKKDSDNVCQALSEGGFYFTKMASSGGFLSSGNTTVLIGTDSDKVDNAISIIRDHCSKRVENVTATVPQAAGAATHPTSVVVGGATVFVTEVSQFEKM